MADTGSVGDRPPEVHHAAEKKHAKEFSLPRSEGFFAVGRRNDAERDPAPLILIGKSPLLFTVNPKAPAKKPQEGSGRSRPGTRPAVTIIDAIADPNLFARGSAAGDVAGSCSSPAGGLKAWPVRQMFQTEMP
jgi:hypothetical protein